MAKLCISFGASRSAPTKLHLPLLTLISVLKFFHPHLRTGRTFYQPFLFNNISNNSLHIFIAKKEWNEPSVGNGTECSSHLVPFVWIWLRGCGWCTNNIITFYTKTRRNGQNHSTMALNIHIIFIRDMCGCRFSCMNSRKYVRDHVRDQHLQKLPTKSLQIKFTL